MPVEAKQLTLADIEVNIASEHFFTAADGVHGTHEVPGGPDGWCVPAPLKQLTFCVLLLRNGTRVVGINYGAIDPEQFNKATGRYEARAHAIEQVKPLMGYELRSKLAAEAPPSAKAVLAAYHAAKPCTFPACGCNSPATCTR